MYNVIKVYEESGFLLCTIYDIIHMLSMIFPHIIVKFKRVKLPNLCPTFIKKKLSSFSFILNAAVDIIYLTAECLSNITNKRQ